MAIVAMRKSKQALLAICQAFSGASPIEMTGLEPTALN